MKIGYRTLTGGTSTAYLDCDHNNQHFTCGHGADQPHVGADKYTDDPVAVLWNDTEWVEVDFPAGPIIAHGTTLRLTGISPDGKPADTATVINGHFHIQIEEADGELGPVTLTTAWEPSQQPILIQPGTRAIIEIWSAIPGLHNRWGQFTFDSINQITPAEITTTSVTYTGHVAPPAMYPQVSMNITARPRTRTQTKRLTRAQRKGKR